MYTSEVTLNGVGIPAFAFLTVWTYTVLTVYLTLHFLSCLLYACRRGGTICRRLSNENHRHMFHELQVQPSLWADRDYDAIPGTEPDEIDDEMRTIRLSWLTKLVWILYNIASSACLVVTLGFWILLYPHLDIHTGKDLLINIQLHGITSVIIMLEICVTAIPIRLPHMVFTLAYGALYFIFSGVYYAVDHRHVLYPNIIDWSKPGVTMIVFVVAAFVALPLIQLFLFGLYRLRLFIFDKCNPEQL